MTKQTITTIGLISAEPFSSAIFAPKNAPINCPAIITKPINQNTSPKTIKYNSADTLLVKFKTFAFAVAFDRL